MGAQFKPRLLEVQAAGSSEAADFANLNISKTRLFTPYFEQLSSIKQKDLGSLQLRVAELAGRMAVLPDELSLALQTLRFEKLNEMQMRAAELSARRNNIEKYKTANSIDREPQSEVTLSSTILVLAAIASLETILNAFAFAEASAGGLFGGLYVATALSLANIVIAALIGAPGVRNARTTGVTSKATGILALGVWVSLAFLLNLLAGHYRAHAAIDPLSASRDAWLSFSKAPLSIPSIEGWLLVIIGLSATSLAVLKITAADDPDAMLGRLYRGWRRQFAEWTDAKRDCVGEFQRLQRRFEIERQRSLRDLPKLQVEVSKNLVRARDGERGQKGMFEANHVLDASRNFRSPGEGDRVVTETQQAVRRLANRIGRLAEHDIIDLHVRLSKVYARQWREFESEIQELERSFSNGECNNAIGRKR